ncbi:MAG: tape measure protein [Flavobacteriaceae bacterium]
MANLLEYTLSLRDQMSANLSRIGVNSDMALNKFAALERQSIEVNNVLTGMGRSVGSLKEKLALLKSEREWIPEKNITVIKRYNDEIRKLEGQINRMETVSGSRTGQWFREAFQSIPFAGLLTNPLVVAGAAAGKALKLGIEQDLQNTSFQVLLGSEEAAKKMVQDIAEYGKTTPYDKMGVGENAKTMLSFGLDEAKIMPTLKAIGDIAMGDANKMSSLTLAYSQMSSTGKLMGQDLLQMINAGFNPLNEISKMTGKSIGDLKQEMEKGLITTKMVEDAYMNATSEGGQFHNMAEKMGQTLGGRWAQFMDTVNEKFLIFYTVIEPVVSKLLELGSAALDTTFNGLGWLVDKFQEGNPIMLGIVAVLGVITTSMILLKAATMAQTLWTGAMTLATNISTAAWWANNAAMWANPVTWIIAGIITLIALIGYLVYGISGWGKAWEHTVQGIKYLWEGFIGGFKAHWNTAVNVFMGGIDAIKLAWYKFKEAVGLGDSAENQAMIDQIQNDVKARAKSIIDGYAEANEANKKAAAEFGKAWDSLDAKSFSEVKDGLLNKLGMGGISDPTGIPGASGTVNSTLGSGGDAQTSKSNQAIATGGTKHNYITINLDSLIGIFNSYVNSTKESGQKAADEVTDGLLRTLAMATTAGS